ncbi:MAG: hypothetical protein HYS13_00835 [Planctomycetia bacterium]|nr:hypothetical protein [Planctomycetia bacterium]
MRLLSLEFERRIADYLAQWVGKPVRPSRSSSRLAADLVLRSGDRQFIVEFKKSGDAATVGHAIAQLEEYQTAAGKRSIPLLVVPYMGKVGEQLCGESGVSWLDLSGNARIEAPGLRVFFSGRPNQFKRRGRPATVFAPKSARVARQLLIDPKRWHRQRELSKLVKLGEGFVSRIVRALEADGHLLRDAQKRVRPREPALLLDAWREVYDFSKHRIIEGHIAARSGESLLPRIADELRHRRLAHAATGLAAAWLLTRFSAFRIATFYVARQPESDILRSLEFRPESRGANTWLVVPNDEGVFAAAADVEGICCVHPVQAYLDLKGHPERAAEAADEVRQKYLKW